MNLLVCLPYHKGDYENAERLLSWITELNGSGSSGYSILLAGDDKVSKEDREKLKQIAAQSFQHVVSAPIPVGDAAYPVAANVMFFGAAKRIEEQFKLPWLWMEPDCVPVTKNWISDIASEYFWAPKKFMGPFVRSEDPKFPEVHLNGIAVYPQDAHTLLLKQMKTPIKAWDIATAEFSVPRATECSSIYHFWGQPDMPPIFRERRQKTDAKNINTIKMIPEGTALFHRTKDGGLIDILRKNLSEPPVLNKLPEPEMELQKA